jgi:phosphoglycolate phosphatase-like HAD superfamily hydrolase
LIERRPFLPAFPDVSAAPARAASAEIRLFTVSNGTPDAVFKLLEHAAIGRYFLDKL